MRDDFMRPPLLWKYRPWDTHSDSMIRHGEAYFSSVQSLNDPFEFRWLDKFPDDPAIADQFLREQLQFHFPDDTISTRRARYHILRLELDKHFTKYGLGISPTMVTNFDFGVFCAAEDYRDLLMWSHYADKHRGVCVAFKHTTLYPARVVPCIYTDDVPVFDVWDYFRDSREKFVTIGRTKGKTWEYEKEWRTIGDIGAHRFPAFAQRVVIGAKATPETRAAVLEAVNAAPHRIEVCEASLSARYYRLDVRPLKPAPKASPRRGATRRRGK